ncbi:bifunctional AP2-coincident [Babesia duncani]|uniref:Bifunctional AP2-coincident n=1 Tax=Babesia duncani TaxID=323732 RepID=A0AAD9UQB3_9APIC|nr:bifunctional AP2-coincident [Babesia duncani]
MGTEISGGAVFEGGSIAGHYNSLLREPLGSSNDISKVNYRMKRLNTHLVSAPFDVAFSHAPQNVGDGVVGNITKTPKYLVGTHYLNEYNAMASRMLHGSLYAGKNLSRPIDNNAVLKPTCLGFNGAFPTRAHASRYLQMRNGPYMSQNPINDPLLAMHADYFLNHAARHGYIVSLHKAQASKIQNSQVCMQRNMGQHYMQPTETRLVSEHEPQGVASDFKSSESPRNFPISQTSRASSRDGSETNPEDQVDAPLEKMDATEPPASEPSDECSVVEQKVPCPSVETRAHAWGESSRDGPITEQLRQYYIQKSKLLPKVRGVWFNSTVRRMGWVGQAYKRCKRIEKIFSIAKHGFEGARQLAIEFRNSQKPANGHEGLVNSANCPGDGVFDKDATLHPTISTSSQTPSDVMVSDVNESEFYVPQSDTNAQVSSRQTTLEDPLISEHSLEDFAEEAESDFANELDPAEIDERIRNYSSNLTRDEKLHRDYLCKGAILFMLHELDALLELNIPIPPLDEETTRKGLAYHIQKVECAESIKVLGPYLSLLGRYICESIPMTEIPHAELYALVILLSFGKPIIPECPDSVSQDWLTSRDFTFDNVADYIVC